VDLDARVVDRWRSRDERPEVLAEKLVWQPATATEPFELNLPEYFSRMLHP